MKKVQAPERRRAAILNGEHLQRATGGDPPVVMSGDPPIEEARKTIRPYEG